jgi:Mrp family chromosome partitioning ATPase
VIPRPQDVAGVPVTDPASAEYGALRALRVALEFASTERPTRNLIVAPAVSDPGTGWLSVNLAIALADVGHRVLLIDADRTCRRRHPVLDTAAHPGLYDMLAGTVSLDAARLGGPVEGVSVVPLGNVDLAAPSLLEMRFRTLLAEIDEKYDVILIQAAPLTESDDARIMATGGGLLLTAPLGRVRPAALAGVMRAVQEARIRVMGAVLVGARPVRRAR